MSFAVRPGEHQGVRRRVPGAVGRPARRRPGRSTTPTRGRRSSCRRRRRPARTVFPGFEHTLIAGLAAVLASRARSTPWADVEQVASATVSVTRPTPAMAVASTVAATAERADGRWATAPGDGARRRLGRGRRRRHRRHVRRGQRRSPRRVVGAAGGAGGRVGCAAVRPAGTSGSSPRRSWPPPPLGRRPAAWPDDQLAALRQLAAT